MTQSSHASGLSTFRLRRRTPGSFLLVPCPRQGRSIRCQGQLEAAATVILVACPLACLLPLILCITLVLGLRDRTQTESALAEILVEEIAADRPLLLPSTAPPTALGHEAD